MALILLAWGAFAFGMTPSLQLRVVSLAGPGGQLASSLPASAINLGIALGSLAGGMAYSHSGVKAPVITGLVIAVTAIAAAVATRRLAPPVTAAPPGGEVPEPAAAPEATELSAAAASVPGDQATETWRA